MDGYSLLVVFGGTMPEFHGIVNARPLDGPPLPSSTGTCLAHLPPGGFFERIQ
jgi:hypothetical protein